MSGQQFLTEKELNAVKGLLHYLNNGFETGEMTVTGDLHDANGDKLGTVMFGEAGEYAFHFPESPDG